MPPVFLASDISTYQIRRICRFFSTIKAYLEDFGQLPDGRMEPSRRGLNSGRSGSVLSAIHSRGRQILRSSAGGPLQGRTLTRFELALTESRGFSSSPLAIRPRAS